MTAHNGAEPPSLDDRIDELRDRLVLAQEIADEATRSDIESFGRPLPDGWYDISPHDRNDDYERMTLARAARYLALRNRLEVDPSNVMLVRVR